MWQPQAYILHKTPGFLPSKPPLQPASTSMFLAQPVHTPLRPWRLGSDRAYICPIRLEMPLVVTGQQHEKTRFSQKGGDPDLSHWPTDVIGRTMVDNSLRPTCATVPFSVGQSLIPRGSHHPSAICVPRGSCHMVDTFQNGHMGTP